MRAVVSLAFSLLVALLVMTGGIAASQIDASTYQVVPGDTWLALSLRFGIEQPALLATNAHINLQRQPVIGDIIQLPGANATQAEVHGQIARVAQGGLLRLAAESGANLSHLAQANALAYPATPGLYQPLLIIDENTVLREWPIGLRHLELSVVPAQPGIALAMRAGSQSQLPYSVQLNNIPFNSFTNQETFVSVGGTNAFFAPDTPELLVQQAGAPAWAQPWRFIEGSWDYDRVTLTGAAAAIDQASIDAERARLFELWSIAGTEPLWSTPFTLPIRDYLEISSTYGARRSYNGGPFRTFHEGVDFSAYGGTLVTAPAGGVVVLAELLYVRGGAVIIDHGLGIYSGYYHLSNVLAEVGQRVEAGAPIGEVGTTGFSGGNHLHWDLLVAGVWIDAATWLEQNQPCWILAAWNRSCILGEG